MNSAILCLKNISKSFPSATNGGNVCVLENLSFSVDAGEYVSLLGRSGCGKSTLLYILAGLEKPDSGSLTMHGQEVLGPDKSRMLMFQDATLFPWLNVLDNVQYGLRYAKTLSRDQRREHAMALLSLVGLEKHYRYRVHELSGGMRQRVALARALAPDPEILLMDEPFSALDAMTREQLYSDMQRIWQETKKTVIMVTHNAREAACLSTRILMMASHGDIINDQRLSLSYPRTMNDVEVSHAASGITALLQQNQAREETCA